MNGSFVLSQTEHTSDDESDADMIPLPEDLEFIDDSNLDDHDNVFEVQKEHYKNVKRIAKNLEEFSDCLSFEHTNMKSLKAFIMQML